MTDESTRLPSDLTRDYLMTRRQTLLMELGAIERMLSLPRSRPPRHEERERLRFGRDPEDRKGH